MESGEIGVQPSMLQVGVAKSGQLHVHHKLYAAYFRGRLIQVPYQYVKNCECNACYTLGYNSVQKLLTNLM